MISYNEVFQEEKMVEKFTALIKEHGLDGFYYEEKLREKFDFYFPGKKLYFVSSATAALEVIALSMELQSKEEIILPSFTYSATANAFVKQGAKLKFVDIEKNTLNLNLEQVRKAITANTRAVVPIHYGGNAPDMEWIKEICREKRVSLIEDNAHGFGASYKKEFLGNFGDFAALSFHFTKNITAGGEGGLLIVSDGKKQDFIESILDNGTNKNQFLRGETSAYCWSSLGGAYRMSPLQMAYLLAQSDYYEYITNQRKNNWNYYQEALQPLEKKGKITLCKPNALSKNNGHIFYFLLDSREEKQALQNFLMKNQIQAYGHYEPLHSTNPGRKYGSFFGESTITEMVSQCILRLPIHYHIGIQEQDMIIDKIYTFFEGVWK